jgi:succinate-acetate transporter protein
MLGIILWKMLNSAPRALVKHINIEILSQIAVFNTSKVLKVVFSILILLFFLVCLTNVRDTV